MKLFKNNISKQSEMEKEIFEQSSIIDNLYEKYVDKETNIKINLPENINRVVLIASGSSYNCAAIISYLLREYTGLSTQSIYASEFAQIHNYETHKETLYIFISQSGETSDTIEALNKITKNTKNTVCVTNTELSTLYNIANYKLLTYAGKEKSIAATKSLSSQLYVLCLVIAKIMEIKNIDNKNFLISLKKIPEIILKVLSNTSDIKSSAKELAKYNNITLLGSGCFYPLAKEGALKIREISYINTNAYPTGEFLHGHVAALNNKTALVVIISNFNKLFGVKVIKKIEQDYSPLLFVISDFPESSKDLKADFSKNFNYNNDLLLLFSTLIIFQYTSLEIGKILKRNIDNPDGLNKVVKEHT